MIIVTGSGRSGTSAVARVLHESGISMGRDLLGPTEFNARGYYEERDVVAMNDRILAGCGLRPADGSLSRLHLTLMRALGSTRLPAARRKTASRAEVLTIAARYGEAMQGLGANVPSSGGLKDPRFCWTLEAWLPYFSKEPRVIVCLRSPEAIAASVMRIYGLVETGERREYSSRRHRKMLKFLEDVVTAAGEFWSNQYQRLLEVIDALQLEATCVEYDALNNDPEGTVARLAGFVGRPLDPRYIEAPLRHYTASVPERYSQLYERVLALSRLPTASGG